VAAGERAFYEAFFTWVYTPRAHADGTVDEITEEALAFPPNSSPSRTCRRRVDRLPSRDTADRLGGAPRRRWPSPPGSTRCCRPASADPVAGLITGARFEVIAEESDQPFEEVPDDWNARVDAFSREA
jgi:hypothetical protein